MEKDTLKDDREDFDLCVEAERDQRKESQDDLEFALLEKQWDERDVAQRKQDGRPCLTINKLKAFGKQVVNDGRLNQCAINVKPVGDGASKHTADIQSDLIRNIETQSQSDTVYNTAFEFAVYGGFGYFRVNVDYTCEDAFDQDIMLERISNPFSVYGDYEGKEATSIDWNRAYVTDWYSKSAFESRWGKDHKATSFETGVADYDKNWFQDKRIRVAERWIREEVPVRLLKLSDGSIMYEREYLKNEELFAQQMVTIVGDRETMGYKVKQRLITGTDILEENDWLGRYIPIIPMYGEEVNVAGTRHFISLVRRAKDAQRMFNYWRPLALDTAIPTPTGWTTMGDIKVGEQLYSDDGKPCTVIGKSPVHIHRDCFRVSFDDGSSIVADGEHPWVVEERGKRVSAGQTWSTKKITTAEMVPGKHFIQTAKPIDCPAAELPVDPYLLGLWLGDGSAATPCITPGDEDIEEVRAILESRGHKIGVVSTSGGTRHGSFTVLGMSAKFREIGVIGNKHIPAVYLRGSEAQRWELLQGLMDSDGSIGKNRQCSFVSTNLALSRGFAELVRSLGIKAVHLRREGRHSKLVGAGSIVQEFDQYSFSCYPSEPVFKLDRKAVKSNALITEHRRRTKRHRIVAVERVASVPVQCVAIDAPSHLFLAGESMVPTHNTSSTELVALSPKTPFIGAVGQFATDAAKWQSANSTAHAYIEYDILTDAPGLPPPQRQPFAGVPAGALQEALNASDDMKAIIGMYDASLGARSNETSGIAINARKREGDTSTFDFIDNRNRAVEHGGRVILDLIPKVYTAERIMRCVKEDGTTYTVPVNQPVAPKQELERLRQPPPMMPQGAMPGPMQGAMPGAMGPQMPGQAPGMPQMQPPMPPPMPQQTSEGQHDGPTEYVPIPPEAEAMMSPQQRDQLKAITKVFDLTTGKYDVLVTAGPSFGTRREESAVQMMDFIRSYPAAAPLIGDLLAKTLDWPGADQIAERLKAMLPPQAQGQINPMVQHLQQMLQQQDAQAKQAIAQLQQQLGQLNQQMHDKSMETQIKAREVGVKEFEAQTRRAEVMKPEAQQQQPTPPDPFKMAEMELSEREMRVKEYEAETERLKVLGATLTPDAIQMLVRQTVMEAMGAVPMSEPPEEPPEPMGEPAMPGEMPLEAEPLQ